MSRGSLIVLLALALLAAACSSDVAVSVDAAGTPAADDAASDDAGATPSPEPGDSDEAEEPTATPEPTAAPPEPTPTPEPELDAAAVAQSTFAELDDVPPEFYDCAIQALIDDPSLLELAAEDDFEQLDPAGQAAILDLAVDCLDSETVAELFAAGMAEGAAEEGFELSPEAIDCFTQAFASGDDRRALIEIGLDEDAQLSPESRDVFVEALVDCMPAELFVELVVAEALADPIFSETDEAFDAVCLDTLFRDETFLRPFWTTALDDSFDQTGDGDMSADELAAILPILDCLDFAAVLQAQAAADGFELSDESATCLNDAIRDVDLFGSVMSGDELDEAELGLIVLECLTFEELSALGGG